MGASKTPKRHNFRGRATSFRRSAPPDWKTQLRCSTALVPLERMLVPAMLAGGLLGSVSALANPLGGQVVGGAASISQPSPTQTTINQSSQSTVINWQSFNIPQGSQVDFNQPNASSVALNRDLSTNASTIAGQLKANGQVWIVNPNGVAITPTAQVNVGGLVATTSNISNSNFLAGIYKFDQPGKPNASVVNQGHVTVAQAGLADFVAPSVANSGVIQAKLGKVNLASGSAYTIDMYGDGLIKFAVSDQTAAAVSGARVSNTGTIDAAGGTVTLSVSEAESIVDNSINAGGTIAARSVGGRTGSITVDGNGGTTLVSGTLDASGTGAGQTGGTVKVLGGQVGLTSTAKIDVAGAAGGGTVDIGGDFHGAGPDADATNTNVASGATIDADAIGNGNGGQVAVWSNDTTNFGGTISARGGSQGGNGGYVETSGEGQLDVGPAASVSAAAPMGIAGTWLLDPDSNVTITNAGDALSGNVYQPSADNSELNVAAIISALNGGTNVVVTTTNSSGTQPGNILLGATPNGTDGAIDAANGLNMGGAARLTLQAGSGGGAGSVTINSPISDNGLPNPLSVQLIATSSGSVAVNNSVTIAGTLFITAGGNITQTMPIAAASLSAQSGSGYVDLPLANAVSTVAGGTGNGAFDFNDTETLTVGTVEVASGITTQNGNVVLQTTSGDIDINEPINVGTAQLGLSSAGGITQGASGAITAGVLEVLASTSANLTGDTANQIAGASGAAGIVAATVSTTGDSFTLQTSQSASLDVGTANVSAGSITLSSTSGVVTQGGTGGDILLSVASGGGLALNQQVNANGGTTTLGSSPGNVELVSQEGSISQDATNGTIVAAELGVLGNTGVTLLAANRIGANDVGGIAQSAGLVAAKTISSGNITIRDDHAGMTIGSFTGIGGDVGVSGVTASDGQIQLATTNAGAITVSDAITSNGGEIDIAAAPGSGITNQTAAINSSGGNIVLLGDTLSLGGGTGTVTTGSTTSGTVVLGPSTSSLAIGLGAASSGTALGLQSADFATITAGMVQVGYPSLTGNITFAGGIAPSTGNFPALALVTGGAITENTGEAITYSDGTLGVIAGGGSVSMAQGNTAATLAGFAGNSGTFTFIDDAALTIGTLPLSQLAVTVAANGTASSAPEATGSGVPSNPLSGITTYSPAATPTPGGIILEVTGALTLDEPLNANNGLTGAGSLIASPGNVGLLATGAITQSDVGVIYASALQAGATGAAAGSVALASAANEIGNNSGFGTAGLVAGNATGAFSVGDDGYGLTVSSFGVSNGATSLPTTIGVTTTNTGDIVLETIAAGGIAFDAAVSAGGSLTATAATSTITQTAALSVGGTSSFTTDAANATITLTNAANALNGAVALDTNGTGGTASLTNDLATVLAASSVGGALTVDDKVGNLSQSGALSVGGTSSFTTDATNATITLNTATNALNGAVALDTNGTGGTASLTNDLATVLAASSVGGALTVDDEVGNLSQSGALSVGGTSSFTTDATNATITLTTATNALNGAVALNTNGTGGTASLTNDLATVLAASSVGGALTVDDKVGNLSQSGALSVGGTSSFTTDATNATITLTNATNALNGAVALDTNGTGGTASLTNDLATVLAASSVGGALTVDDKVGNLSQSGALSVGGTSSFTTDATNATITLNTATNALTGAVSLNTNGTGGTASLTNDLATVLAASSVGGALTVDDKVGNLSQSGALSVGGTSSFTTDAANATITLTNAANALNGAVALDTNGTGGTASLTNDLATVLAASSVGGALTVDDKVGNLSQSGALSVGGTSSFTTDATNATITLNTATNALTGAVSLNTNGTGGTASLINDLATVLAASSVGGALTVDDKVGNLSQSGALSVGGTSSFTADATNATITLNTATNALTGAVSLNTNGTAGTASLTNDLATVLAASSVGGALTVDDKVGNLSQSGALSVGGTSSFTADATNATITLTNATNALNGAVALDTNGTGGTASLTNDLATVLAASSVGGALTVDDKVGNLSQSGALSVGGTSSFTTDANATIILTNAGNALTGAVALNALGNASLTDSLALTVGGTVTGTTTTLSAPSITLNGLSVDNLAVTSTVGDITTGSSSLTVSGTLSGSSAGNLELGYGPSINALGSFTASDDISLNPSTALTVSGPVSAQNIIFNLTGTLTFSGDLTATAPSGGVVLNAGAITQTSGVISATDFLPFAGGTVALTGANRVTNIAGQSSTGDFSFFNAQALTVSSVSLTFLGASSSYTGLSASGHTIRLGTSTGSITQGSGDNIGAANLLVEAGLSDTGATSSNVTLNNSGNGITADIAGSASGAFSFENNAAFTVGSVTGVTNIPTVTSIATTNGDLTLDAAGTLTLPDALSSGGAISLQATNNDAIDLGANLTAANAITLGGAVTLDANLIELNSTGGGNIIFASTVDGAHDLTTVTNGTVTFDGLVGTGAALTSLTTEGSATLGSGTTDLNIAAAGTQVITTGTQAYDNAVVLSDDATVKSTGGGNITFAATIDGAHNLTTVTSGTVTFDGLVGTGTALTSLTTEGSTSLASGTTDLNIATAGTQVITAGAQSYDNSVVLSENTTLQSTANPVTQNANITFGVSPGVGGTIDSDTNTGSPWGLAVGTGGTVSLYGAVGSSHPLTYLDLNDGTIAGTGPIDLNGLSVTTTGSQGYGTAVTLSANLTAVSMGGGNIIFAATVDGAHDLATATNGTVTFDGLVGTGAALTSLTTEGSTTLGSGTTDLNIAAAGTQVITTGTQAYDNAVVLSDNTALKSTANGTITFGSTLDDSSTLAHTLTISAGTGNVDFDGRVGANNPGAGGAAAGTTPGTVTIASAGTVNIDIPLATPNNNGFHVGALSVTAGSLDAPDSYISTYNPTGNGGAVSIATTGGIEIGLDLVTAGGIAGLTGENGGAVTIAAGGAVQIGDRLSLTGNVTGSGNSLAPTHPALGIDAAGYSTSDSSGAANQTAGQGGAISIAGASINLPFGAYSLGGSAILDAEAGAAGGNAGAVTLTATAGNVAVGDAANGNVIGLDATGGSAVGQGGQGGTVTIAGTRVLLSEVNARGGDSEQTTASDAGTGGSISVTATATAGAAVTLYGDNDDPLGPQGIVVLGTRGGKTGGSAGSSANVLSGGTIAGQGGTIVIQGTGGSTLQAPIQLVDDSAAGSDNGGPTVYILAAGGTGATSGAITLNGSVEGDLGTEALFVQGGAITVNGTIGPPPPATGPLVAPDFVSLKGTQINLYGDVATQSVACTGAECSDASWNPGQIVFSGPVTLMQSIDVTNIPNSSTPGNVTFNNTVSAENEGVQTLLVATNGTTTFLGQVGPTMATALGGLTTEGYSAAAGTTDLNIGSGSTQVLTASSSPTTGYQTYDNKVVLSQNTVLQSTAPATADANIAFGVSPGVGGTIDAATAGGQFLKTETDGTTTFFGQVGSHTALASLTTAGSTSPQSGTTDLNILPGTPPVVLQVMTTGTQSYDNAVVLSEDTGLASTGSEASGNVTFASTVNGGFALVVNTAGTTGFDGAVGGTAALASVMTDAPGVTDINGGTIRTTGTQTFNDPVILSAAAALTSTGGGNVTFASTVNGGFALMTNTAGTTIFDGAVGGSNALSSLTVMGTSDLDGGLVSTTGSQSYQGATSIGAASTNLASSGNGNIAFGGALTDGNNLSVSNGQGAITMAGSTSLRQLTLNTGSIQATGPFSLAEVGAASVWDLEVGKVSTLSDATLAGQTSEAAASSIDFLPLNATLFINGFLATNETQLKVSRAQLVAIGLSSVLGLINDIENQINRGGTGETAAQAAFEQFVFKDNYAVDPFALKYNILGLGGSNAPGFNDISYVLDGFWENMLNKQP